MNGTMRLSELRPEGTSHEEKCDILFQLLELARNGGEMGADPSEILLRDGDVEILRAPGPLNLLFMPPEIIRACASGASVSMGLNQKLFLIGMFAYYLYYGEDYYARNRVSPLDNEIFQADRASVIPSGEALEIPFCARVSAMTSINERKREDGARQFEAYCDWEFPKKAEIHFMCEGREIRVQTYPLTRENYKNLFPKPYLFLQGEKYMLASPLNIRYRPGTRRYEAQVSRTRRR